MLPCNYLIINIAYVIDYQLVICIPSAANRNSLKAGFWLVLSRYTASVGSGLYKKIVFTEEKLNQPFVYVLRTNSHRVGSICLFSIKA